MSDAEQYVKAVSEAIGLPIPQEYLPGTVLNFQRSAVLAKILMEFKLPPETEPAPVYKP
jgi:hypothetical protein